MHGSNEPPDEQAAPPRTARRHVDTVRFIERFEALTGFRVSSDSTLALPREFLVRSVEPPEVLMRKYGDDLELRTRNALCRFEPGREHDRWTFGRLLEIRGFGVFSLLDLLEVLAKHGVSAKNG
jgi:hypothetical protein